MKNLLVLKEESQKIRFSFIALVLVFLASFCLTYTSIPKLKSNVYLVLVISLLAIPIIRMRKYSFSGIPNYVPQSSVSRTDLLLSLRAAAALLVLIMHSGIVFQRNFTMNGSLYAPVLYSPAWLGMVIFFGISGFLIAKGFFLGRYKFNQASIVTFQAKRFLRLVPVMALVFFLICLLEKVSARGILSLGFRVLTFSYLPTYGPEGVHSFWSLTTEMHFYLVAPFILMLFSIGSRKSRVFLFWLSLSLVFSLRLYYWLSMNGMSGWHYVYFPLTGNFDYFLIGMVVAFLSGVPSSKSRIWILRNLKASGIFSFLFFFIYSIISFFAMSGARTNSLELFQFLFVVVLPSFSVFFLFVLLISCEFFSDFRSGSRLSNLFFKSLGLVGKISFPLYLVHSEIFIIIQRNFTSWNYGSKLLLGSVVAIFVSSLLMISVERFGIGLGNRIEHQRMENLNP